MASTIEHQGVVEGLNESNLRIKVIQTSACVSYSAKEYCSSTDNKEKIIEINTPGNSDYQTGDKVIVTVAASVGMKVVCISSFIVPFFILVVSLFLFMFVTNKDELLSVLFSFLLIFYYIVVWAKRGVLKKELSFTVK
jgi:sigma-E factor negative regulatory protein RseC